MAVMIPGQALIWGNSRSLHEQEAAGLRFGDKGTHTSRTMMLAELSDLLAVVPRDERRPAYAEAIIQENVLGKQTVSNRRLTNQRLGELYGLDPSLPIFRVFLRLWDVEPEARPPALPALCPRSGPSAPGDSTGHPGPFPGAGAPPLLHDRLHPGGGGREAEPVHCRQGGP
jgi:hypothetical protein